MHLPSAFGFDLAIEDPAMNTSFTGGIVDRCIKDEGEGGGTRGCLVRPGHHTFNGSFTHFDQRVRQDLHVAVKSAHVGAGADAGAGGDATAVLLTASAGSAAATAAAAQLSIKVSSRFYFDCAPTADSEALKFPNNTKPGSVPCGTIAPAPGGRGLVASPAGLPAVHLRAYGATVAVAADGQGLQLTMTGGAACLVAASGPAGAAGVDSVADCVKLVGAAEAKVEAEIEAEYPRAVVGDVGEKERHNSNSTAIGRGSFS